MQELSSEWVKVSEAAGVATITIDRQKALNALDEGVLAGLERAADGLATSASLRAVIVTGAGEKAFVAGADIKAMAELTAPEARAFSARGHRVFAKLEALPVPVLAACNGFALGGGLELALTADVIYASDNAKFGQPEVNLGLIPGFGGCVRLGRRIGLQAAKHLIYTGETIDAARALGIGLVAQVFPAATLQASVAAIAATIASRGPVAVRAAKRVLAQALEVAPDTGNMLEQQEFGLLFASADQREGTRAFIEKRAAAFSGR